MRTSRLIVMMTDFGTEHWYDAAMKGEILRRAQDATILDLSHDVPRHSVEHGAFLLHCAIESFPKRTIFLCVVDPGVGSERRTLVGWVGGYGFVGPDNGLVTPLLDRAGGEMELHEIKSPTFRNPVVSATFHGRDLFAPAAARLCLGDDPRMAGPRVTDPVRLVSFRATETEGGAVQGRVMMVDHFGNAITNIDQETYGERMSGGFNLTVRGLSINEIHRSFASRVKGETLAYWGSSRYLEIAVNFGSAAAQHGLEAGDPVGVKFKS